MPSSTRRSDGRLRRRRAFHRRQAERDWADGLPLDALLAIFHRLDHVYILMDVGRVCRSWRRTARDEPSLWRCITMRSQRGISYFPKHRQVMASAAVHRSAGQCEAFCGHHDAGRDGAFLAYLSEQAPCLKSLRLVSCRYITNKGLKAAVKKFPQLEELEISLCDNISGPRVFKVVGKACPQLKRFRLSKECFSAEAHRLDKEAEGIANMHELNSLQLFGNLLTNKGLVTILDNCPKLESLDIRHCFNVNMDKTLLTKCVGIRNLRLPNDPTDDYDLKVKSPRRTPRATCWGWSSESDWCTDVADSEDSDF